MGVGRHLPKSSSQNLQLSAWPPCADSTGQNGFRDTRDSIPRAMSAKKLSSQWDSD